MVSTINGDSNVPFYKELANQGLKATDVPVVAFSVGKRSCAASIPNRWSATSRHGTTLSPSIIRPTKPLSPIIARMPKRTSCRMPIRW
nr:urea ABC transporter, urea binding protein [Klebsiella pneumoniae]